MATAIKQKIVGYRVIEPGEQEEAPAAGYRDDADRRLRLEKVPQPAERSLRWVHRPRSAAGNPSWTYWVAGPEHSFALTIGHIENGHKYPFEVWAIGEPPRGLAVLAKSLSMDMRSEDRGFLRAKLESLLKVKGKPFDLTLPDGKVIEASSETAAFARLVLYRCEELGAFAGTQATPVLDALMSRREPKTEGDGGLSWYADIGNQATGDDCTLFLKELILPNGQRRPFSVWLSGEYPRSLDGLCKVLSYDLRVVEPRWGVLKLRQLLDYVEPRGEFWAPVPGSAKRHCYPSTVAYIATLILHRMQALGVVEASAVPDAAGGALAVDPGENVVAITPPTTGDASVTPRGLKCEKCGAFAVKVDGGCSTCLQCSWSSCG